LGVAYVDGWWDSPALDQLFEHALQRGGHDLPWKFRWTPNALWTWAKESLMNLQTLPRALTNVRRHYNLGNDLFIAMLDPLMMYSCGYWSCPTAPARTLEQAQVAKVDLICRKIGLHHRPGMTVLDIGCGWGGFARFAAERYGARVTGITLSQQQLMYAKESCRGLPVDLQLLDYRSLARDDRRFDRVVSIGMFEHVGYKNYDAFMHAVDRSLSRHPEALALLHFFASDASFPNRTHSEVNWISRHIFPGMSIPSLSQVGRAAESLFVVEDLHNFGPDYDPTLLAWHDNFENAWAADGPLRHAYGERFRRLWRYYLLSCAGAFRARRYQLWQVVLSRGNRGVYVPAR
jgi:cyclopropane-fatty-acyl-phospholipid synthase